VDGHAYAYRAFYAIRSLNAPDGSPTNAIYGFLKMLGRMRATVNPTHVAVIWDGGLSSERTAAHPEYKAQRPPMPDGLAHQMDGMVEYLRAAGLASWCRDGVEADDWIAVAARRAVDVGARVVIASADKDFMQLVTDRVGLLNPGDKSERIWKDVEVMAKTGVRPEQIVDWLSLVGDSVDNIPGVPGVGPKTATGLLQQFGSLDALYLRLAEVKSDRVRESLTVARGAMVRNQELIRLRDDVGVEFQLADTCIGLEDTRRLAEMFRGWGFRGLLNELEARQQPEQGELL
jgi:DNA polymerase I